MLLLPTHFFPFMFASFQTRGSLHLRMGFFPAWPAAKSLYVVS